MPFDSLLFFGDAGNGDHFGFRILQGKIKRSDVFAWNHEDDSRRCIAHSLRYYIEGWLTGKIHNFLWMMFRSGWGSKEGQEVVLAIWLKHAAFDFILAQAVHSTFHKEVMGVKLDGNRRWNNRTCACNGTRIMTRRGQKWNGAIQLGLRVPTLARYAHEWILDIQNISCFVRQQRQYAQTPYAQLVTPQETVYPVADAEVAVRLGVSQL